MAKHPTDANRTDPWPRRASRDDPLDVTSDDTFDDEVTIPIKPSRPVTELTEDAEWPPRLPSPPAPDESGGSARVEPEPEPLVAASAVPGPGLSGLDTDGAHLYGEVPSLDRPPVITRPWVPERERAPDIDAITRRRRPWTSWLPIVLVMVGTAVAVGLVVSWLP